MSITDTAKYLGVSRVTVYRWMEWGMPHYRLRRAKFDRAEIDAWIQSLKTEREKVKK